MEYIQNPTMGMINEANTMQSQPTQSEAQKYLDMDIEELYASLLPEDTKKLYSKKGGSAKGQEIFLDKLTQTKEHVCKIYQANSNNVSNLIDFVVLLSISLAQLPTMVGIPVVPMAAIVVKIGIEKICKDG